MTRYISKRKKEKKNQTNKQMFTYRLLPINEYLYTAIMIIDHAGYGKRTLFTVGLGF